MITQEKFDNMVYNHKIWLDSEGKEGERFNLSCKVLKNIDGSNLNLQQAIINESDIIACNFTKSDFRYSNIKNSKILSCDFNDGYFSYANLNNSIITGSKLNEVIMISATVNNVEIIGTDMSDTLMEGCNLRDVIFNNVDLNYVNMDNANLKSVTFKNTYLYNMYFENSDLMNIEFNNSRIYNTNFYRAKGYYSFVDYDNNRYRVHAFKHDSTWMIKVGSFWGTLDEYEKRVRKTSNNRFSLTNIELLRSIKE